MPSTAATASGTAAGSATAASSKTDTIGKFIGQARRDLGGQSGLADPAHTSQRHQPMLMERLYHLGDLGLRPMKLVGARRKLPGLVSSARSGGNSARSPGART
jgi:hypothetical protein